jgi:hypothetical protein
VSSVFGKFVAELARRRQILTQPDQFSKHVYFDEKVEKVRCGMAHFFPPVLSQCGWKKATPTVFEPGYV